MRWGHRPRDYLGKKVGAAVFCEFAGVNVQSAILTVESVNIRIEIPVVNGVMHLCILEDIDPVGVVLLLGGIFHIGLTLILVPYFKGKGVHKVGKFHTIFHYTKVACVLIPDAGFVVKPHFSFRHIA